MLLSPKINRRQAAVSLGAAALTSCARNPKPARYDAEVLILGAGLAGLRAAQILSNAGKDVLVLDANDRVGGRVHTLRYTDGIIEAGGARIGARDVRLNRLITELGLTLIPDTAHFEEAAYWIDGKPSDYAAWQEKNLSTYSGPFIPDVSDGRIIGGAQRLPEAMAAQLRRPPRLKTYITALSVTKTAVAATDHKGRVWRAPQMVCTLPFSAMRHLSLKANMPMAQKTAISRLPYTQKLQIHFRAKVPFWEKDGLPPDMRTNGPLEQILANRNAAGEMTGLFSCTISGSQIEAMYQEGQAGLHQNFRTRLTHLRPSTYGSIEILDVVNWTKDNHAAGGAYWDMEANQNLDWIKAMGQPYRGLYFAGSHQGLGTIGMEAALDSAERAASAILT